MVIKEIDSIYVKSSIFFNLISDKKSFPIHVYRPLVLNKFVISVIFLFNLFDFDKIDV